MENSGLPNDVALLREALAFIGDLDGDDARLSPLRDDVDVDANDAFLWSLLAEPEELASVQTTPAVQAAIATVNPTTVTEKEVVPSPPPLAWPTANGSRKYSGTKRRQEILYLREMVGELESKLTHVKQQTDEQKLGRLDDTSEKQVRSQIMLRAAWAEVVTHQSEQRERAEKENIKLKQLLEDQIQVGKSLEQLLLRKRPKHEHDEPLEKRPRLGKLSPSSPWDSVQIFQELMASIDRQYSETARVLTKVLSLHDGQLTHHRKVELVHDEALGMVLQSSETRTLPFEYELAAQEFWQVIPLISNDRTTGHSEVDMSGNLIKTKFSASASFGRVHADIAMYAVDRRFREPHRTVFVTSVFVDPTKISDINTDGVCMRHRSWVVLETMVSESGRAATQMTSYAVTVPQLLDGFEDQTRKVGTLTNFVMTAMSIELENRQQAYENRLFDRSWARAEK